MIQRQSQSRPREQLQPPYEPSQPAPLPHGRVLGISSTTSALQRSNNSSRRWSFAFCFVREICLCLFILWLRWGFLRLWEASSSTTSFTLPSRVIVPYEINITIAASNHNNKKNQSSDNMLFLQSLAPRSCRSNAIVIMAQKKHSTYARDSFGLLLKALDLLHDNYFQQNSSFIDNVDVFIFHTGDLNANPDLELLEYHLTKTTSSTATTSRGLVHLVNLKDTLFWKLPPWHKHDNREKDWSVHDLFPLGYRHMCRWFGIQIWNFFEQLNQQQNCHYRYLLRLDEDSFIHSPIRYDLFDFMQQHNYIYGYRLCAYELDYNKLVYNWFNKWHERTKPLRTIDWELCGFYNNFFVADLQFFTSRKVKNFLREMDRMGFIYRKRYGDLIIHSMAVYAFGPTEQIHRFLDFTYQHVTIDHVLTPEKGCVVWGGIQAGYNDLHASRTLDDYYKKRVIGRGCTANVSIMGANDLSPSYSHLPAELKQQLALRTIVAGKVETPHKGILSG